MNEALETSRLLTFATEGCFPVLIAADFSFRIRVIKKGRRYYSKIPKAQRADISIEKLITKSQAP